jgi:hypothetical protein
VRDFTHVECFSSAQRHPGQGERGVIGEDPMQVELQVTVAGGADLPPLPAGTRGRASRFAATSNLALFIAATGERAVVPLTHLRRLDGDSAAVGGSGA